MCEADAYILKDGNEEKLLESIDTAEFQDGKLVLVNIFGERREVSAVIRRLSLVDHRILLEETSSD